MASSPGTGERTLDKNADVTKPLMMAAASYEMEEVTTVMPNESECLPSYHGCLADPDVTAMTALKARQLRLFSDALTDERFKVERSHVDPADGVPRSILDVAVGQWASNNDTRFVVMLLEAGAKIGKVDEATEVAPIHQVSASIGTI